jgi:hypothetical protein
MIARVLSVCARNEFAVPPNVVTIPAATAGGTKVFDDTTNNTGEVSYRGIQNIGANPVFYCFGGSCDGTSEFHGILQQYQSVPCPGRGSVYCYSVSGSTIATTQFNRDDLG